MHSLSLSLACLSFAQFKLWWSSLLTTTTFDGSMPGPSTRYLDIRYLTVPGPDIRYLAFRSPRYQILRRPDNQPCTRSILSHSVQIRLDRSWSVCYYSQSVCSAVKNLRSSTCLFPELLPWSRGSWPSRKYEFCVEWQDEISLGNVRSSALLFSQPYRCQCIFPVSTWDHRYVQKIRFVCLSAEFGCSQIG